MTEVLHRTGRWIGELVHTKRDGQRITVLARKTLDREPEGNPVAVLENITDISARRELEDSLAARAAELAQADRSKDEFLAMLAHELRNPLSTLHNATELLKAEDGSGEERALAHGILTRQIANMTRMIDDLLDVSRITEGKIELRKKTVTLESILTSAADLTRSNCAKRDQELTVKLPARPILLQADATRLEQVFGNLLTNACKYGGDGCHIAMNAVCEDGEVVVSVSDDGTGIAEEVLPHVFDLFMQASHTLDRAHGGLGIGLTLVQRLVKLHGGSVEARSEGLGKGAEFVVRLPILHEAPHAPQPIAAPSVEPATPRRILIVDDNPDSARSLAIIESRQGHKTWTALNGPDALAIATEFLPDVVLLDIGLPGMTGLEVAQQIRAIPALQNVLVIGMSGYGRSEDFSEAKRAGFDRYLVKPLDLDELHRLLRA
jgi:signal transduction histidine kinase/CheY-like chemotaxis protein